METPMENFAEHSAPETPADRLWYAIRELELLAHELDKSDHNAAEIMCLSYPNRAGNRVTFSLDYVSDSAGLYAPRIQTLSTRGPHLSTETIVLIDDKHALIAEGRQIANEVDVDRMAGRVSLMYNHLQQRRKLAETTFWITAADKNNKKNKAA